MVAAQSPLLVVKYVIRVERLYGCMWMQGSLSEDIEHGQI